MVVTFQASHLSFSGGVAQPNFMWPDFVPHHAATPGNKLEDFVNDFGTKMGVSKNNGTPKWMVEIMETLLKWMIWGYHYFRTSKSTWEMEGMGYRSKIFETLETKLIPVDTNFVLDSPPKFLTAKGAEKWCFFFWINFLLSCKTWSQASCFLWLGDFFPKGTWWLDDFPPRKLFFQKKCHQKNSHLWWF